MKPDNIVDQVTTHYLGSQEFNGLLLGSLQEKSRLSAEGFVAVIKDIVSARKLDIVFGDRHPNPHIKAFPELPPSEQIGKLSIGALKHACAYPSREVLLSVVKPSDYEGTPYSLELATGAGQLEFRAFDLMALEHYRNDPRYLYDNDDLHGHISISDAYYASAGMPESDKTLLETFGFCYDEAVNRAVAVFLRYLSRLTPEHQQIWQARKLDGQFVLHPDYYRNCILGDWGTKIPLCDAFLMELRVINAMAKTMGRPDLFRNTYRSGRPREFGFLVRPTLREYNGFVHLLDKLISDNISKDFFEKDISDEVEETRSDGKIVVRPKGTLQMLQEWITKNCTPVDPWPMKEMFETLRSIRKQRQKPAHKVDVDRFDQGFFQKQREILISAYRSVRTMRLILADHPVVKANPPKIDELLCKGDIWTY
ncbi:MAG: AAA family ATPase [Phycisphaerae bacterium]|nr:AAA family ATPase [Phycisphaerae bacterium]